MTIAAAVEEQGAATESEIARNVQEASIGTQQVSSTIVTVNEAASESGRAAGEMLGQRPSSPIRPPSCRRRSTSSWNGCGLPKADPR